MPYAPTTVPLTGACPLVQRSLMADNELAECGKRGQRIVIVFEHRYMHETDSVVEPDGNVAEPVGQLFGELGEHRLDQLFVLVGGSGTSGVADYGGVAHNAFPCSESIGSSCCGPHG